jgi:hypothetical protein
LYVSDIKADNSRSIVLRAKESRTVAKTAHIRVIDGDLRLKKRCCGSAHAQRPVDIIAAIAVTST